MTMIPYGRQDIDDDDISAVTAVLRSDYLTQGPVVEQFETALKEYCGADHAVAVSSATAALHIACRALGLQQGDSLWVSPITFAASANCAIYCGASIDFIDIEPDTFNISISALQSRLALAERGQQLPKIVMAVHMAGQSCDMEALHNLSQRYGFYLIEDASHAVGAEYQNHKVGACQYSDITVFSFHPVKIITSGEGGMALTNDESLAAKMRLLRQHGITREPEHLSNDSHGAWYYEQLELGYNYRLSDIHAALGLSQLRKLDAYIAKRNSLAACYDKELADLPLMLPAVRPDRLSAFHLYIVRLAQNIDRGQVFTELRRNGIGVNVHYIPVYKHPYYRRTLGHIDSCTEAEKYYQSAITLPLYATMSSAEQSRVIDMLHSLIADNE